ncbi:hypothetical protein JW968_00240 [Candidatus Woesearchaeota archaeon]|nr:hypothetical protein [Candidatus Woesearchaeota archaeon]
MHPDKWPGLSPSNKQVMEDFFALLEAQGLTHARRSKYIMHWKNMISWMDKDILEASNKEDLIKLAAKINSQDHRESTKDDHRGAVQMLYKTITTLDKYENLTPIYFWIYDRRTPYFKKKDNPSKKKEKEEWFNEDDVMRIIEGARNLRDKCWISITASQGLRPEELLTIRKQDISEIKDGIKIKVSGKTGTRDIYIYESWVLNHISSYVKSLPKDKIYLFDISIAGLGLVLKEICQRQGINKRAYPYKLRKFSVTMDRIKGVTTGALEQKYGWRKGTKVIVNYDKSSAKDYQREIRALNGLESDKVQSVFDSQICLRCQERNPADMTYCKKCGLFLKVKKEDLVQNEGSIQKEMHEIKQRLERYDAFIEMIYKDERLKGTFDQEIKKN